LIGDLNSLKLRALPLDFVVQGFTYADFLSALCSVCFFLLHLMKTIQKIELAKMEGRDTSILP
jgi:hypothetical protein